MKYVMISTTRRPKFNDLKKGDRIAVQVDDDIFLATITRRGKEKYSVLFDDGDTQLVSRNSKRILGLVTDRKRKSPVPKSKLSQYLKESSTPTPTNRIRRPRHTNNSLPKSVKELTDEQKQHLRGWSDKDLNAYLKLPTYRDLFDFFLTSHGTMFFKDLNEFKEDMLKESHNNANKPFIEKLTLPQIKKMLDAFIKLNLIEVTEQDNLIRIDRTSLFHNRSVGLSWAKLLTFKEYSSEAENSILNTYDKPSGRYVGD